MESWTLRWSKLIDLNLLSTLLVIPSFSGVYRLSYQSADGRVYVFYVGQAESINARISQHLSPAENNPCINHKCFVRYARVDNCRVRDGAELYLFSHYSPSCNIVTPSGPNISINLE